MKIKNSEEEFSKNDILYKNIMEDVVKDTVWKQRIKDLWEVCSESMVWVYPDLSTEAFLSEIYKQSTEHFDIAREVQVIVDSNNNLFMSVGTPGFVSFANQDDELFEDREPMRLPIKCWIHTHPNMSAYFSGTDWRTIDTWKGSMESAIVLGQGEMWAYDCETEIGRHTSFMKINSEMSRNYNKMNQGVEEE